MPRQTRSRKAPQAGAPSGRASKSSSPCAPQLSPRQAARPTAQPRRIFLLSPANLSGVRGKWLLNGQSQWSLRLRESGVPVGELFAFVSGLYFRGKLAYAQAFAPAGKIPGAYVITSCFGLLSLDEVITVEHVRAISAVPVHPGESKYRVPLERDARALARRIGKHGQVVLLGSIATPKYVEPLSAVFGERLLFPVEFAGLGDMSRGGLMLRCARAGCELEYQSLMALPKSARHSARPPLLTPASRAGEVVPGR